MKKNLCRFILAGLVLAPVLAVAGLIRQARLGPATGLSVYSNTTIEAAQAITLAAPSPATVRNCLTKMSMVSSTTSTVRILDGGTTVYSMDLAAATPLYEVWDNDDMCAAAGAKLTIKISTGARLAPVSTQNANYSGFTY
jgi:hypothetical protein